MIVDVPGVEVTGNSLTIPPGLAFEEYEQMGARLGQIESAAPWWIGDWLLFGEHLYGEKYAQAVESTGVPEETLVVYQWVAKQFPPHTRLDGLSWTHHRSAAAADTIEERQEWVEKAKAEKWSTRALANAMKGLSGVPEPPGYVDCPTAAELEVLSGKNCKMLVTKDGQVYAEHNEKYYFMCNVPPSEEGPLYRARIPLESFQKMLQEGAKVSFSMGAGIPAASNILAISLDQIGVVHILGEYHEEGSEDAPKVKEYAVQIKGLSAKHDKPKKPRIRKKKAVTQ